VFSVQLYQVQLCNGEAVSSLCSFIMLSFVIRRQCVLCAALLCKLCIKEAVCSL
jgi:hypothetical protein